MKGYVIKRAGAADSFLLPALLVTDRPAFGPRSQALVLATEVAAQSALRNIRPFVGTARFDIILAQPDREAL